MNSQEKIDLEYLMSEESCVSKSSIHNFILKIKIYSGWLTSYNIYKNFQQIKNPICTIKQLEIHKHKINKHKFRIKT